MLQWNQAPEMSMLDLFFIYHIVSIVIGASALVVVFVLYLKTKNPRLSPLILANGLVVLLVTCLSIELYFDLWDIYPPIRGFIHEGEQFVCLGLCMIIPRVARPPVFGLLSKRVERTFVIVSALIAAAFAFILLFHNELHLYLFLYMLIYLDLSLAVLYFAASSLFFRRQASPALALRNYDLALVILRWATVAFFPALFLVDFVGWMIPVLRALIPEGLSILPLFYLTMSLDMLVGAVKDILESEPPRQSGVLNESLSLKCGLTKREAEILPLLLQFMSYKEIGETLFISPGTVRTHLIHIYQKTGVRGRLELARLVGRGQE
jgi:DNA-binding CsgD family transcriptional regulator